MRYAKSTNGFYSPEIHGDKIPADAVEITDAEHAELMVGQSAGKLIGGDADGKPVLSDPPAPTREQLLAQAQAARAAAYRDEADPLFFMSQRGEATVDEWKAKIAEIKSRIPDPA